MGNPFAIPLENQRPLFGVFLACHAIPDAIHVLHTGVGCKAKAHRQIAMHDRLRPAHNKMVWSDLDERHLIAGSIDRLISTTLEAVRRRQGVGLVLISGSAALEMTGADLSQAALDLEAQTGCPVRYLPAPGFGGDWYQGYTAVVQAALALRQPTSAKADPRRLDLVGHLFDRYEHDQALDLFELERLLKGLGLTAGTLWLSGLPATRLRQTPRPRASLVLPLAGGDPEAVARITGQPTQAAPLPLGLAQTRAFLACAAEVAAVPQATLEAFVAREQHQLEPLLALARERLQGRRLAILANTPTATGLCDLAQTLGLKTVLVGLLDRSLGGAPSFTAALRPLGLGSDRDRPVLLGDPSAEDLRIALQQLGPDAKPEILIAPDLGLPEAELRGVAQVELGLPRNRRHVIYGQPILGFRGCVALAQRLMDAAWGIH